MCFPFLFPMLFYYLYFILSAFKCGSLVSLLLFKQLFCFLIYHVPVKYQVKPLIIYTSTKSDESLITALQQNGNIIITLNSLFTLSLRITYLLFSVIQMVQARRLLWSLWRVQYLAMNKHGTGAVYFKKVFNYVIPPNFCLQPKFLVNDSWWWLLLRFFGCNYVEQTYFSSIRLVILYTFQRIWKSECNNNSYGISQYFFCHILHI